MCTARSRDTRAITRNPTWKRKTKPNPEPGTWNPAPAYAPITSQYHYCSPRSRRHPGPTTMTHRFTIGVEEEFQIVDPSTWALRSHVSELLATGALALGDQIKREMHQSIVEVGTPI